MTNAYKIRCKTRNGFNVLKIANNLAERDDIIFAEPNMAFTTEDFSAPPVANFSLYNALVNQYTVFNSALNPSFLLNYIPSTSANPKSWPGDTVPVSACHDLYIK